MADTRESIDNIRRQLAESRIDLAASTSDLGASLDVPARVREHLRQRVATHPWKWALLAIVGGVVVARTVPLAVALIRTAGSRKLVGALLGTVGPWALRTGLNTLAAHRPDIASFLHPDPEPPPPPPDDPSDFPPGQVA